MSLQIFGSFMPLFVFRISIGIGLIGNNTLTIMLDRKEHFFVH